MTRSTRRGSPTPRYEPETWDCIYIYTFFVLSTNHLEQGVAAVAVGLLVVLHQAVQRAELQALVHQRAAPGQTQSAELSLTHFI